MVAVSTYCSARLLLARHMRRRINVDINIAHVSMGVAMAGMLVPALTTLPTGLWEAVFVGLAAWFGWQSTVFVARHVGEGPPGDLHHVSHYLTHLVMSCAMLYMYFAASPASATNGGGMAMGAAGGTADYVGLPLFFLAVLSVSAVWHVDRLSVLSRQPVLVGGGGPGAEPGHVPSATLAAGRGSQPFLAPRAEMLCHIAMCITMGYMLVLML